MTVLVDKVVYDLCIHTCVYDLCKPQTFSKSVLDYC